MKTIPSLISALVATGSTVVAMLSLAGIIPADLGFASLAAFGLTGFALYDYSRPRRSLTTLAPILRPSLPSESASPVAYSAHRAA